LELTLQQPKQQEEKIKPPKGFTLDYLDYDQREKILKHLKAGKTFKCHHKNCESFEIEFTTLYEYNVHYHTRHKRYPLHPELSLIKLMGLEPRGNPWEPDSSTVTIIDNNESKIYREVGNGLDFLLSHFYQERLFPRKIQTHKSQGKQIEVFSKEEAMKHFEQSDFVDCRINNFPSYTNYKGIQRYPPDSIFIDIDRSTFKEDKSYDNAVSRTLKNIKNKLNGYPTVNNSGNGCHIVLPIECPVLEQIEQFQKYKDIFPSLNLSQEFLRFAEDFLSNGKADTSHHPSFKSCQIRIPGSINWKCLDNRYKRFLGYIKVKILQEWNKVRAPITREFIEDFRTYLEQKVTDQKQENNNTNQHQKYSNINNQSLEWIEKLLKTPIEDFRKNATNLILAPYFINIEKLSYQESFNILIEWLKRCDSIRKLDFNPMPLAKSALNIATQKKIPPMKLETLRNRNSEIYQILQKL
jgi:uncharacterized lipoprotein YehR (DUF1307 family)